MPNDIELEMIKVRRLARKNLNANPLQYFAEFWDRVEIDEDNNWLISSEGDGYVIRSILNGRPHVMLNAGAGVGNTATIGSLMSWNCAPNFFSDFRDKEDYIESKLIIVFSVLAHIIGGAAGELWAGFNDANTGVLGNDAVYVHEDVGGTVVGTGDGGGYVNIGFVQAMNKVQLEICNNYIDFFIGSALVQRYVANLPDAQMYIWFRVSNNATLRIGPMEAYYEKTDIERN